MREKTERKIKEWIEERSINEERVKKLIHKETPYLKVCVSPKSMFSIYEKIYLQKLLEMLLKHLNLEVVIIEESVELKKKKRSKLPVKYAQRALRGKK